MTAPHPSLLARGTSMKEALHYDPAARYVPLGGAKGAAGALPARGAAVRRELLDDR